MQLALGGNCKTLIICAINPAAEHIKVGMLVAREGNYNKPITSS
jgi:hypothetical protein